MAGVGLVVLDGTKMAAPASKQAKEILDNELDAKRAAHEAHLAERAKQEERQGHKLCGQKPKAPEEKAGHKDKKANTTDPSSKVMSTKRVPPGLQRSGGRQRRPGRRFRRGHRRAKRQGTAPPDDRRDQRVA